VPLAIKVNLKICRYGAAPRQRKGAAYCYQFDWLVPDGGFVWKADLKLQQHQQPRKNARRSNYASLQQAEKVDF
jgi:hypothetical protein